MRKKHLILVIFVFSILGCRKQGCTDSSALNYDSKAKKNDGSCIYAVEPDVPQDPRDQFVGMYAVLDSSYVSAGSDWVIGPIYEIEISTDNTLEDTIYIFNAGNFGILKTAFMTGDDFIMDIYPDGGFFIAGGKGSFGSNTITYEMTRYMGGPIPNVYGKGVKI